MLNLIIQQRVIYPNFVELEKSEATSNITRVTQAFKNELSHLELFCKDWSLWDEGYEFVQKPSQEFIDENLMLNTFEDNSLCHISYHSSDAEVVWSKTLSITLDRESENSKLSEMIPRFIHKINAASGPIPQRGITGVLITDIAPLLVTVQPIMNSERTSQMPGVLVMARYIDTSLSDKISKQVEVVFSLNVCMSNKEHLFMKENVRLYTNQNNTYTVKSCFETLVRGEHISLEALYPRTISFEGRRSIITAQLIMGVTMIVLMIVVHRLISSVIINRIEKVSNAACQIRDENSYDHSIAVESKDEIGKMIGVLNEMIRKIHVQTEELDLLARVDGLTGLNNRRMLDELLEFEWAHMRRKTLSFTVLLIDIDFFKMYNDHYGHIMGDEVLMNVGSILKNCIKRDTDSASRYGGEEFCILLPDTDGAGGEVVSERICKAIRELAIPHSRSDKGIITLSIGIATITPNNLNSIKSLLEDADSALYQAKEAGRDQWKRINRA